MTWSMAAAVLAQNGHWKSQNMTIVTPAPAGPRIGSPPRTSDAVWENATPVPATRLAAAALTMRPSFQIFMRVSPGVRDARDVPANAGRPGLATKNRGCGQVGCHRNGTGTAIARRPGPHS